ncbi:MAG: DUF167 domain-containing protein [Candidatus Baltobacteraceae bacterium]|jgi:hypothetical protein
MKRAFAGSGEALPVGTLAVTVKPNSKAPGIRVEGEAVEIRVAAPARDGLANEAVRRELAGALGVPLRDVALARGAASKHKAFEVAGLERAAALAALRARAASQNG